MRIDRFLKAGQCCAVFNQLPDPDRGQLSTVPRKKDYLSIDWRLYQGFPRFALCLEVVLQSVSGRPAEKHYPSLVPFTSYPERSCI